MASNIVQNAVTRGRSGEIIQKIYKAYKDKPFTFQDITKKVPQIRPSTLASFRNSNVIKLTNGKIRCVGRSKTNPMFWKFTTEALMILKDHNG